MRIGIVTKWLDELYTGVGQYSYRLIKALLSIDKENQYFFIHKRGGDNEIYKKGTEVFLPNIAPGPMWIFAANLFMSIRKNDLDVVHEPFLGLLLPSDFKLVQTVHDLSPLLFGMAHPTFNIYFKTLMGRAVRNADAVITDSENTKKDVLKYYDVEEEKVQAIHLGFEHTPADPENTFEVRKRLDIQGPYILTVGNLVRIKNLGMAIESFAKAVEKGNIPHKLVLAGKKDLDHQRLKGLVRKHGLSKKVVFTDYLGWDDIISLYSKADMLLFPSLYEGFGFPPLEAMGYQVPVIASTAASIPEVVGDAAISLDPDDKKGWTEAILRLVNEDGLRKELIRKGDDRVRTFTWERCARETLDVYRRVCKS